MKSLIHVHGGNLDMASRKYGLSKEEFIDLSANINPLGPSSNTLNAIINNLGLIKNYPDPDCYELKLALSNYLNVDTEHILMGNGAAELIYLAVRAIKCKRALIPVPTFGEYSLSVLTQGGGVIEIPMDESRGFLLNIDMVINSLPGTDLLFLCNPNNPTGRISSRDTISFIIDRAKENDVITLVDESFIDFLPNRDSYSVMPLVNSHDNLMVLYSLTKFFSIPGLRLGAIIASRELISLMNSAKDPWNVNTLAQLAGLASLQDLDYINRTHRLIKEEKRYLFKKLSGFPCLKPLAGAANYLMVEVSGSGLSSNELTDILGKKGILVRDCASFSGLQGSYIRIAVKTRYETDKLLNTLKEVLLEGNR